MSIEPNYSPVLTPRIVNGILSSLIAGAIVYIVFFSGHLSVAPWVAAGVDEAIELLALGWLYEVGRGVRRSMAVSANNSGTRKESAGDLQGAAADYDRALRLNPQLELAYRNRGVARHKLGDRVNSLLDLEIAISIAPDFFEAYQARNVVRHLNSDILGAFLDCEQMLRLRPDSAIAHYNRACALCRLGRVDELFVDLYEAIRLDPKWREQAQEDADFEAIREHPSFIAMLNVER